MSVFLPVFKPSMYYYIIEKIKMIVGNSKMLIIDGATYVRVSTLGLLELEISNNIEKLHEKTIYIGDIVNEYIDELKLELYKELEIKY